MKMQRHSSCAWAAGLLVVLGLLALYFGPRGLMPLIGAAIVVWYAAIEPQRKHGEN